VLELGNFALGCPLLRWSAERHPSAEMTARCKAMALPLGISLSLVLSHTSNFCSKSLSSDGGFSDTGTFIVWKNITVKLTGQLKKKSTSKVLFLEVDQRLNVPCGSGCIPALPPHFRKYQAAADLSISFT
jgi:hypothetical protein